jgi:hypothetical protein
MPFSPNYLLASCRCTTLAKAQPQRMIAAMHNRKSANNAPQNSNNRQIRKIVRKLADR